LTPYQTNRKTPKEIRKRSAFPPRKYALKVLRRKAYCRRKVQFCQHAIATQIFIVNLILLKAGAVFKQVTPLSSMLVGRSLHQVQSLFKNHQTMEYKIYQGNIVCSMGMISITFLSFCSHKFFFYAKNC
jgi:hypothetical protein